MFSDFVGIDVSKSKIDVFFLKDSLHKEVPNDENSLREYFSKIKDSKNILAILENTGGYERTCMKVLLDLNFKLHRTDNLKMKYFVKSLGKKAKTDMIDAKYLALYGKANHSDLKLSVAAEVKKQKTDQLVQYSDSLKKIRASEIIRSKCPAYDLIADVISETVAELDRKIKILEKKIDDLIEENSDSEKYVRLLESYKGIGRTTAVKINSYVPEIGKLGKREIASLCGVAPHARDSGSKKGYRKTSGSGRRFLRSVFFQCTLSAVRYNKEIKDFYDRLIARGKLKMVAIVACMRKIIVQINAIARRGYAIR